MTGNDSASKTLPETPATGSVRTDCRTIAETLAKDIRAQILEIILVFAPVIAVVFVFRMFEPDNPMIFMAGLWLANLMMIGIVRLGIGARGDTFRSIGLNVSLTSPRNVFSVVLKSIPIAVFAIAAFVVGSIIMANVVGIPEPADMTGYNYLQGNPMMLVLSLMGVYIVSSFGEEVVYRGFLITRLHQMFGPQSRRTELFAVLISSVIFGLAHFEWGAMGVGQTTCMGVAFGVSYLLTKRTLWPLVLAHAYMDTLLLVPLYFAQDVNV